MSEYESTSPEQCSEVGLGCRQCTENTARELAQVCKGLRKKDVAPLFVQIYPAPACSRMHAHFVQAYLNASEPVPRRSVQPESRPPRTMAAVA